jgi:hypothetical protein
MNAHRAALEALFAPKTAAPPPEPKREVKLVRGPARSDDPKKAEREKLLGKLLAAQGRPAVSKAADDYLRAGFELPRDQEVQLQMLEHADEGRVQDALRVLLEILDEEPVKRKTVLDSRLRRLEDCAEEAETRELTSELRKLLR